MRKNIKDSAYSFIIILSLMLSYVVYAEDQIGEKVENSNESIKESRVEFKNEIEDVKNENRNNRYEFENKKKEVRNKIDEQKIENEKNLNEIKGEIKNLKYEDKETVKNKISELKNEFENKKEEGKNKIQEMIKGILENRDQFKKEFEFKKEEAKTKISDMRVKFEENLIKIKDEVKKGSTEKIVNKIIELNTKITNNFLTKIDQIENVLVSIQSRMNKAESKGIDVSLAKIEFEKAKIVIESTRTAISKQALKVYEVNITDEANLKTEMKNLRDTFSKDIKTVNALIKASHESVKNTATTLAKIPNINDYEEKAEIEDTNTNNQ